MVFLRWSGTIGSVESWNSHPLLESPGQNCHKFANSVAAPFYVTCNNISLFRTGTVQWFTYGNARVLLKNLYLPQNGRQPEINTLEQIKKNCIKIIRVNDWSQSGDEFWKCLLKFLVFLLKINSVFFKYSIFAVL